MNREQANAVSVRLELQADCFAGVYANSANRERKILEEGDVEEGLNAAAQIGDDRIQKRSQGYVVPEGFTHGTPSNGFVGSAAGYRAAISDSAIHFRQAKYSNPSVVNWIDVRDER